MGDSIAGRQTFITLNNRNKHVKQNLEIYIASTTVKKKKLRKKNINALDAIDMQ